MRLAHYSDIHVTVPPLDQAIGTLGGKRMMGALNYYVGGRRRHFAGVEGRIERLLADIDDQKVDHALCTGDVTQMSYMIEFERLSALYGDRKTQPERHTIIPGNHDRYTPHAAGERRFEATLGAIAPPEYPHAKPISGGVTIVTLDAARPNALLDSSGLIGEVQLRALEAILTDKSVQDRFVILALHYGLLRPSGLPDNPFHGIRDANALLDLFRKPEARLDLVLHGHIHRAYKIDVAGRRTYCAGSATDLAHAPGYNVYEIDAERRTVISTRRRYDEREDRYVATT